MIVRGHINRSISMADDKWWDKGESEKAAINSKEEEEEMLI